MSARSNQEKQAANRRRVLLALTKIAQAGDQTPTHAELGASLGIAKTTVQAHLTALAEAGDIVIIVRDTRFRQIVITSTGHKTRMCVPGFAQDVSHPETSEDRFSQILASHGRFEDDPRAVAAIDRRRMPMKPATIVASRLDAYAA